MKKPENAALFDLDGVIIDSEGTYSLFWADMAQRYEVPIPDFANYIKGTTLSNILDNNFPETEHKAIISALKQFEGNMTYSVFPGVIDFLSGLMSYGIPASIVTSSGEAKMKELWRQQPDLRKYFAVVVTDAMVIRSKPDPEGYLLAASMLQCPPEKCYVFEDSYNGLKAGRSAGAKVIGLSTTNPASEVAKLSDMVISGFEDFGIDELLSI